MRKKQITSINQITQSNANFGKPIKVSENNLSIPVNKIIFNNKTFQQEIIPIGFLNISNNNYVFEKINNPKEKTISTIISDIVSDIILKSFRKILQSSEKNDKI